jgi:hypothetical protein
MLQPAEPSEIGEDNVTYLAGKAARDGAFPELGPQDGVGGMLAIRYTDQARSMV